MSPNSIKSTLLGSALIAFAAAGCTTTAPEPARAALAQAGYTFHNVTIKGGGFVTGFVADPETPGLLYARTDVGGAYRWNEASRTWTALNDFIPMGDANLFGTESIAVDPTRPGRVYLAQGTYTESWSTNGAIYRSDDYGKTFQRFDLPIKLGSNDEGRSSGERLMVDPNQPSVLYLGSRRDGLWRSPDAAKTWTKVASFPVAGPTDGCGVDFIVFQKSSGRRGAATPVIYVGVSTAQTSLYRSADAGATWQPVPGAPVGMMPNHAQLDWRGVLYLTYGDKPGPNGMIDGAVWKYDTKSGAWANITPVNARPSVRYGYGYGGLAVDGPHPGTLYVATMDRWSIGDDLFRTTDGGARWTSIKATGLWTAAKANWMGGANDVHPVGHWMGALAIPAGRPDECFYGTGAGIFATFDARRIDSGGKAHWSFECDGFEETVPYVLVSPPVGPHLISGVGDIGGFTHYDLDSSPAQGNFKNPNFSSTTGIDFAEQKPSFVVRCGGTWGGNRTGAYSLDAGFSWQPFGSLPSPGAKSGQIAVTADGSSILWRPDNLGVYCSRDHGASWQPCAGAPADCALASDRIDPSRVYALDAKDGAAFVSTDRGASFHQSASGLPKGIHAVKATTASAGDLWAIASDRLFHSSDGARTFTPVASVATVIHIGFGKAAPGSSYPAVFISGRVAGASGVFRSDDAGGRWTRVTDDRHQYGWIGPVTGDPRVYGRVYFGTGGRGVVYADRAAAQTASR